MSGIILIKSKNNYNDWREPGRPKSSAANGPSLSSAIALFLVLSGSGCLSKNGGGYNGAFMAGKFPGPQASLT
jgi:hypothetical protein